MTRPRKELVSLDVTPYYHIVSRCVRRTFLCGYDNTTQTSYEHRRQWLEERIRLLSSVFAIDLCAYAVLSNHYHLVIKLDPTQAEQWSEKEVVQHWQCLFTGPLLIQRFAAGASLSAAEHATVSDIITVYRNRLGDLSWFMKCLNESIARRANQEDNCTGHFWESRYKSQALLTEEALISAMAYVDLNPIRAAMAQTLETSDHTSIKERIKPCFNISEAIEQATSEHTLRNFTVSLKPLLPFDDVITQKVQRGIPFRLTDYLDLVDWTGRAIRNDKRGHIPNHLPTILERLSVETDTWLQNSTEFEVRYRQRFQPKHTTVQINTGWFAETGM